MSSRILVDEIYGKTSGTSAMEIDSSGRVTQPSVPAFWANRNSGGTVSSSSNYIFEDVELNQGSCYNSTTGKFTAPIDGIYFISAEILSSDDNNANEFGLYKNSDTLIAIGRAHQGGSGSSGHNTATASVVINLTANDTVFVKIASGSFYGDSGEYNRFMGYLIG